MASARNPFNPRTVLIVLLVGSAAFLLFLYAIGQGWDGSDEQQGEAHAAAQGLQGYSAFVNLADALGYSTEISRDEGKLDDTNLLVLTPTAMSDGEALTELIQRRRWAGPTIMILPKWYAGRAQALPGEDDPPNGWVRLYGRFGPNWLDEFETVDIALYGLENDAVDVPGFLPDDEDAEEEPAPRFTGMGASGRLPAQPSQWMESDDLRALVSDGEGRMLAGYQTGADTYPSLEDAALPVERDPAAPPVIVIPPEDDYYDEYSDYNYSLVIVSEPDLFNNYGMADEARARTAMAIVEATLDGEDMPIVFDLTVPGYGQAQNLLTLAFSPPFLAATLCLLLAGALIAWRAFRRYGPPALPAGHGAALGKTQLVTNGAALVERTRRYHLLGAPYAALMGDRIARALGIRLRDPEERAQAIDAALIRRSQQKSYIDAANAMRHARTPRELLRAARALKDIERTVTR